MRSLVTAFAIIVALSSGAWSQETELDELLSDARDHFRVALLRFTGVELSSWSEYLVTSIPRLLHEDMRDISTHELTNDQRLGYRKWLVDRARKDIGKKISTARAARDALLFDRLETEDYRAKYDAKSEEIEGLSRRLEALESFPLGRIPVSQRKPVTFETREGRLLEAEPEDVADLAKREDLDVVIWGRIEQLEEYVYVEVYAWDRFSDAERLLGTTAARPEEVYQSMGDIADRTASLVLGRDWAHLAVQASPTSLVSVNGVLRGLGTVEVRYLTPGDATITVEEPGFRTAERTIALLPFQTAEVSVSLDEAGGTSIVITSTPAGADVYVRSIFRGTTPAVIGRPTGPTDVALYADGYRTEGFMLLPDSPSRVNRELVALDRNWTGYIRERRAIFYRALGAFAFSVPVPVILGALFDDAKARFDAYAGTAPMEEMVKLERIGNTYYYLRYVGLAASAGLLGNTIWQLRAYIRAAQYRPD